MVIGADRKGKRGEFSSSGWMSRKIHSQHGQLLTSLTYIACALGRQRWDGDGDGWPGSSCASCDKENSPRSRNLCPLLRDGPQGCSCTGARAEHQLSGGLAAAGCVRIPPQVLGRNICKKFLNPIFPLSGTLSSDAGRWAHKHRQYHAGSMVYTPLTAPPAWKYSLGIALCSNLRRNQHYPNPGYTGHSYLSQILHMNITVMTLHLRICKKSCKIVYVQLSKCT